MYIAGALRRLTVGFQPKIFLSIWAYNERLLLVWLSLLDYTESLFDNWTMPQQHSHHAEMTLWQYCSRGVEQHPSSWWDLIPSWTRWDLSEADNFPYEHDECSGTGTNVLGLGRMFCMAVLIRWEVNWIYPRELRCERLPKWIQFDFYST